MLPVKLVFVDDDPDDRELIQNALSILYKDGFLILGSGQDFLTYINSLKPHELPDAVVLDINMPAIDGFQILQFLKAVDEYQQLPVFILTNAQNPTVKKQCINLGAAGYYIKPESIKEFNELLNEIYKTV